MLARRRPESVADDRDAVLQACTEGVHELEGSFDTSIEQIDAEAPLRNFYEVTALRSLAAGKCKLQNVVQRTAALSTTPVIPEALVREALVPPKPRKKTRPTRASKERRLESKRSRSMTKRLRSSVSRDD